MITSLTGIVKEIAPRFIVIDIGGIGFGTWVADEQIFTLGQSTSVIIYFHWNQENGPQLYGFTHQAARVAFCLIISCSGLGPKIGLAVLASMTPQQFFQAIMLADTKALSSINGIGLKKAESMIMHLKDKVAKLSPVDSQSFQGSRLTTIKEVSDALGSLNYSRQEITAALQYVKEQCEIEKCSFDELLRKGLSFLAKRL